MIQLRPFQDSIVEKTRTHLRLGKRAPLVVSPCGSGKTVIFSYLCSRIAQNGKRVWVLAHREELLDQISETLSAFEVAHSFVAAGRPFSASARVYCCSVFSAARRLQDLSPPDYIIIDEAHHAIKGSTWGKILAAFPAAVRIGVTASPIRLSGEPLSDIFDSMIEGPSVAELIEMGFLSKYKLFAPSSMNTSGLKIRGGDFAKAELAAVANKPTVTGDAINEYRKQAEGKRAVAFCVSVEHAKSVAELFTAAGFPALCIDGKMDRGLRRQVVQDFRSGKIRVMTSCDIISEGFDLPAIECAIMLRPTQSLGLWIQQSGRALRPHPGKEYAILLDHAGNVQRHGLPDEDRQWSLAGREKKKKNGQEKVSVKICPKCFAAQFVGKIACGFCGYVFDISPREVEHVEGDLIEVDPEQIKAQRLQEQSSAETMEDLVALGKRRGYRNPFRWAQAIYQYRQKKKISATHSTGWNGGSTERYSTQRN